ncbi:hypothetical protein CS176_0440 [Corynebacterium glutamicum]|nr:hypothetical protein CS176_0440 [Corynebacterium glutamicum]
MRPVCGLKNDSEAPTVCCERDGCDSCRFPDQGSTTILWPDLKIEQIFAPQAVEVAKIHHKPPPNQPFVVDIRTFFRHSLNVEISGPN